jgi:hypothetical protein
MSVTPALKQKQENSRKDTKAQRKIFGVLASWQLKTRRQNEKW